MFFTVVSGRRRLLPWPLALKVAVSCGVRLYLKEWAISQRVPGIRLKHEVTTGPAESEGAERWKRLLPLRL
jgi:hypothetical protein